MGCFHGVRESVEMNVIVAAYMLYKTYDLSKEDIRSAEQAVNSISGVNEYIIMLLKDLKSEWLNDELWAELLEVREKFDKETFKKAVLYYDPEFWSQKTNIRWELCCTPTSIVKLANRLLNIQAGDRVAYFSNGLGNTLLALADSNANASYVGYEKDTKKAAASYMRTELSGKNISVKISDYITDSVDHGIYDRVFKEFPLGARSITIHQNTREVNLVGTDGEEHLIRHSEWLYNTILCNSLNANGRGVAIMTLGGLWNNRDTMARRIFAEQGYIESVILLPKALYINTGIPTAMVVFDKSHAAGYRDILVVDASDLGTSERRLTKLSDEDIDVIVEAASGETSISRYVSCAELADNNFDLSASRYVEREDGIRNGVMLYTVAKRITRGAGLTAGKLDELITSEPTSYQYLSLVDISPEGIISNNLKYISDVEPRLRRYCIKNHDLIIAKNSKPYKIAVAEVADDIVLLANGSVFIITLDETKVNPYFIKAFLESPQGQAELNSITKGSIMPCIIIEGLRDLIIPLLPMNEQEEIAMKYQYVQDEIKLLKRKMDRAIDKISHIFEE